jgi:ribose transport system permease protein
MRKLAKLFSDYGMLGVLLVLCVALTCITIKEQHPQGAEAARQVAERIQADHSESVHVLAVGLTKGNGLDFTTELQKTFANTQVKLTVVNGTPRDAAIQLRKIAKEGGKLTAIAATQTTAKWPLFDDFGDTFPAFKDVAVITPQSYYWPTFLQASNLLNVASRISVIAIIAIGMTIVIITAGIDLSVGSLVALSATVTCLLIQDQFGGTESSTMQMVLAASAGVFLCAGIGAFTGFMVTKFKVPPFIVTLAIMLIARGSALRLTGGETASEIPNSFSWLGNGADLFGIPNSVVLMIVLYVLAHIMMTRTVLGRHIYATGGNPEAARLSGIRTDRVLMFAYVCSGLLAGLGGFVLASKLKSGSPNFADMMELYVIAAVVVGGTTLSGGEGRIFGTLIGALIISVIENGMNLIKMRGETQRIVLGAVILTAVLIDQIKRNRAARQS